MARRERHRLRSYHRRGEAGAAAAGRAPVVGYGEAGWNWSSRTKTPSTGSCPATPTSAPAHGRGRRSASRGLRPAPTAVYLPGRLRAERRRRGGDAAADAVVRADRRRHADRARALRGARGGTGRRRRVRGRAGAGPAAAGSPVAEALARGRAGRCRLSSLPGEGRGRAGRPGRVARARCVGGMILEGGGSRGRHGAPRDRGGSRRLFRASGSFC